MALEISKIDRYALAALRQTDGYRVLLDILERQCEIRETELLRLGPEVLAETVLRKHAEARSGRIQFEALQAEVNYQVSEVDTSGD